MTKWFYAFKDPMGSGDVKIGITANPKSRLGTYQCAFSARSHRARFDMVWEGPNKQIESLEKALKLTFNWNIESDNLGESEWISEVGFETIIEEIEKTIRGNRFKIKKLPVEFPITQNDCSWEGIGTEHWRLTNDN